MTDEIVNARLDRWLWHARFYKTRGASTAAVSGGRVRVNGDPAKPSRRVGVGDRIDVTQGGIVAEFEVLGLPARRGPAVEARRHYRETDASAARREAWRAERRLAAPAPSPPERPDKRDRRRLRRLQRNQS